MAEYMKIYNVRTRRSPVQEDPFAAFPRENLDKGLKILCRFDKQSILDITDSNRHGLERKSRRGFPIPREKMVMIALNYLTTNSLEQTVADAFRVSPKTVSKCVNEIT